MCRYRARDGRVYIAECDDRYYRDRPYRDDRYYRDRRYRRGY